MDKNRSVVRELTSRIHEKTPLIQVVIGPRQIGKTTALRTVLGEKGLYKSADFPSPLSSKEILVWWKEAIEKKASVLGIDEIQKIQGWSEAIKFLWDQNKVSPLKLILTGSSTLLLEKGLKETLAGRYELIRVEHWNFSEAKEVFQLSLNEFIEFGCYPGSVQFLKNIDRWGHYVRDSIVEPAIGRDLLLVHPVENPALLRQIYGIAVSVPAQVISLQKIFGQLQGRGTVPTVKNYLHLLGQAFLVSSLEKFHTQPVRSKSSSPKLIIHDNALVRAFERDIESPISKQTFGHYFENAIGARFVESGWDTFYWKERNLEVDFVVVGPKNEKLAIEVKTSEIDEGELKGLKEFTKRNPSFEPCLISLTNQTFKGIRNLNPEKILSLSAQTKSIE